MKQKFALIAAFAATLALTACGGGGGGGSTVMGPNPASLIKTDLTVGTGAEATAGKTATVTYTGWLYKTDGDHKGAQFDAGSFAFKLGAGSVISGFDQGVTGMKVGGKRNVQIPSSLGYGASSSGSIPPNTGLVFDIELTKVE